MQKQYLTGRALATWRCSLCGRQQGGSAMAWLYCFRESCAATMCTGHVVCRPAARLYATPVSVLTRASNVATNVLNTSCARKQPAAQCWNAAFNSCQDPGATVLLRLCRNNERHHTQCRFVCRYGPGSRGPRKSPLRGQSPLRRAARSSTCARGLLTCNSCIQRLGVRMSHNIQVVECVNTAPACTELGTALT